MRLTRLTRWVILLVPVCYLAACSSSVRTTLSTYRTAPALPERATVRVVEDKDAKAHDELEFLYFSERLYKALSAYDYRQAKEGEQEDMRIYLKYGTKRRERDNARFSPYVHGTIGYPYHRFGSVVLVSDDRQEFEYVRRIDLEFASVDRDSEQKLLSIAAKSVGNCPYLVSVYDAMVSTILTNLDKPTGSVIRARARTERRCTE